MRARALLAATVPLVVAALVTPAGAAPPADAFCVILIEPNSDFSRITVSVDEDTTLEDRAALWPTVDVDRNGVISRVEKDAFRWAQTRFHENQSELGVNTVVLHPDAPYTKAAPQRPVYATTWRQVGHVFHKQPYELPDKLTESSELETQEIREFGFELDSTPFSRFKVSGGRNATDYGNVSAAPSFSHLPKPVIEYVVVRAPPGWIVERIEGYSYNGSVVSTPGKQEVDLPAFDTEKPFNITFFNPGLHEKLGDIGSPGPAGAVLLVGVAAAAWVIRRRRT